MPSKSDSVKPKAVINTNADDTLHSVCKFSVGYWYSSGSADPLCPLSPLEPRAKLCKASFMVLYDSRVYKSSGCP